MSLAAKSLAALCAAYLAGTATPHVIERVKPKPRPTIHRPAKPAAAPQRPAQPAPEPSASAPVILPCISAGPVAVPNLAPEFTRPSLPQPRGPLGWFEAPFGRAGAIPEPETWGMLVLGFGAVGAMARRKKMKGEKA